jgi:hypothetical protein
MLENQGTSLESPVYSHKWLMGLQANFARIDKIKNQNSILWRNYLQSSHVEKMDENIKMNLIELRTADENCNERQRVLSCPIKLWY